MKKQVISILLIAVALAFPAAVAANSAPTYWQGYPSSEIISVREDSPIQVEKEDLLFDFHETDYTMSAQVTAVYQMVNPTAEAQTVQMAFPFAQSLSSLSFDDMQILADGQPLPFEIYIGDSLESTRSGDEAGFDINNVLKSISTAPYEPENFAADEVGRIHLLKVRPTTEQRINVAVDFKFDPAKTKVLTKGFNRYERREDNSVRIAAWCEREEILEIYVLGEDIRYSVSAFTDGRLQESTGDYACVTSRESLSIQGYLRQFIQKNSAVEFYQPPGSVFAGQLHNLYARSLDTSFTRNNGFATEEDLYSQEYYKRIMVFVYKAEFLPQVQKEVRVSYKTPGTMDSRETLEPTYTFEYLLNPARYWGDFKNLSVKILAPEDTPYLIASSLDFTRETDRIYTANLEELPEGDLTFTLYSKEKISFRDKAEKDLRSWLYMLPLLLWPLAIVAGIALAIVLGWHLGRKILR